MGYVAAHDAGKALELFNQLYADGKDVGALLDELACLARDLLILKTAPDSGISMLSGVASDKQAAKLAQSFSGGELLRIMELLEDTMAGFTRNASRRMDAELCILSMCQPKLQLDAQALNARLTRLEERLDSGDFTAPVKAAAAPVEEEELPPLPDDMDAPPLIEEIPAPRVESQPIPAAFWTELVAAVRQELKPPVSGFFITTPNAPIQGVLSGNQVILKCANAFTLEMISKPEILALVGRKASSILGHPVTASAVDKTAKPENNAQMEHLMRFGREHSDIINIKE